MRATTNPQVAALLMALDQAFDQRSWHGPNLRGSLRGVSAVQAAWKPNQRRHSIAEQALHAAYWKYVVRRRLTGEKRGSFALPGSNWIAVPDSLNERSWKAHLALLTDEHRRLRAVIADLDDQALYGSAGGELSRVTLVFGVIAHDLYHAGQINLLKRLRTEKG